MAKNTGPVRLSAVGDTYTDPARIAKFIWVGATTAADTCTVRDRTNGAILWTAKTAATNTHLSENFGDLGLSAPNGFVLEQISAGVVYVYINES